MCGFHAGFTDFRRPIIAFPVDCMGWRFAIHAFPPDIAIIGQCDVGENHVFVQRVHTVFVGFAVGTRSHTEVAELWIDRVQTAVLTRFEPSDVVTHGSYFPAGVCGLRWLQHRKVGFTASRWERSGHVFFHAIWIGYAKDQHVFCQPALVTTHVRCDTQCETFFTQQCITAVA